MLRLIEIFLIIILGCNTAQGQLEHELKYPVDTGFYYKHGNHEVITLENKNFNTIDTIHSAKYDHNNRIIEVFIKENKYNIITYCYDSIDRLEKSYIYDFNNHNGQYLIDAVKCQIYHYNSFDSISQIDNYAFKKYLSNEQWIDDSVKWYQYLFKKRRFNNLTFEWIWKHEHTTKIFYNENKLKIESIVEFGNKTISRTHFQYDSLNRLISKAISKPASIENMGQTNLTPWEKESKLFRYYPDSLIIIDITETDNFNLIEKTIKYFDSDNRIIREYAYSELMDKNRNEKITRTAKYEYNYDKDKLTSKILKDNQKIILIYRYY